MITEYPNFLTEQECDSLISLGESAELNPGKIRGVAVGYRKAKVTWFAKNDFIKKIRNRVSEITNIPVERQESFHFVKYQPNGEYKEHLDGAMRCKTALIYLNIGFVGGETYFPKLERKIIPETGKLVVWDNIQSDGSSDPESLHAGLPVEFGTKYIAVIWIKK